MDKEISKFFKFKTVDKEALNNVFEPLTINVFICNIWTPKDTSKESYLWLSAMDLSIFDTIETKLSAFEVPLEEVYRIQKDFLNYSLIPNIFLYE